MQSEWTLSFFETHESKIPTGVDCPEASEMVFQVNVQIKCDRRFWEFDHAFSLTCFPFSPDMFSHLLFIRNTLRVL